MAAKKRKTQEELRKERRAMKAEMESKYFSKMGFDNLGMGKKKVVKKKKG